MLRKVVIPAKAGIHFSRPGTVALWVPAFAGTTIGGRLRRGAVLLAMALSALFAVGPAHAVRPDEMLADPVLEARAREVSRELRCLVCRNQSIDDSDAGLAGDLRVLVRQRIAAGDSDAEVIAYIRSRYGDFVLLRPPFDGATLLLWGGPALILLLGAGALVRYYRRPAQVPPEPLSGDERQRLVAMLGEEPER